MNDLHSSQGKEDRQTAHGISEHGQPIFDEERQNPKRRKLQEAEQIEGPLSPTPITEGNNNDSAQQQVDGNAVGTDRSVRLQPLPLPLPMPLQQQPALLSQEPLTMQTIMDHSNLGLSNQASLNVMNSLPNISSNQLSGSQAFDQQGQTDESGDINAEQQHHQAALQIQLAALTKNFLMPNGTMQPGLIMPQGMMFPVTNNLVNPNLQQAQTLNNLMTAGLTQSTPASAAMGNPLLNQSLQSIFANGGALPGNISDANLKSKHPMTLSMACDDESLSPYQCLVRKQIELFEAGPEDVNTNAKGRNRQIFLGQVGIRCIHCTNLHAKFRGRGSKYYPAKLNGLYQAAQSMASSHLSKHCKQIPHNLRTELMILRERKSSAGGGKKYWADGVQVLGVVEDESGLHFKKATK